jgi:ADP-heptose:LPS heptosyltransferase
VQPAYSREFHLGDALLHASKAPVTIGSAGNSSNMFAWQKVISDRFYTRLVHAVPGLLFEFDRYREFFVGLADSPMPITKPSLDTSALSNPFRHPGKYAVFVPGASQKNKRWPPEKFGQLAKLMINTYGLEILVAGGPDEVLLARTVCTEAGLAEQNNFAGKTTLPELAKLIEGAEILVSNDSAAVHIAVAVNTKVVSLLNGSHFGRFGPYPDDIYPHTRSLFPNGLRAADIADAALVRKYSGSSKLDMGTIRIDDVLKAVDSLMQPTRS